MNARAAVLVEAGALAVELQAARPPVLLDVRWTLADPAGGQAGYLAGHLPGAVFVDLENELAAHPLSPLEGRHPLPRREVLQDAARRWGVGTGDRVVVYDDTHGLAAARAWWLLRWAGVEDVRLLDGGLAAWRRAGLPTETGAVTAEPGDVVLGDGNLPVMDADGAAVFPDSGLLLDARAGERFRGEVEPVDPRAGHIPGALSAPTTDNLTADGTFRSAEELHRRFSALGVSGDTAVGVYCGSGVTAAHEMAALAVAGFEATLFPGSWSAWSSDPHRPAAAGEA